MKKFTLTIAAPCSENWSNFTPTQDGGFCSTCSKTVVDFTSLTDQEIANYFQDQKPHTCGHFRADQLKHYQPKSFLLNTGATLFKAGLLSLMVIAFSPGAMSQPIKAPTEMVMSVEQLVKGKVLSDEDGTPLAGVNIVLKGTSEGTISDAEGKFEFPRKLKEGDVLEFTFIGLVKAEYVATSASSVDITIRMKFDAELVMMGKVAVTELYSEPKGISKFFQKVKSLF